MFYQCLCELIDNAIAAKTEEQKFYINVVFDPHVDDRTLVDVYITDNSRGMTLEMLTHALQLGATPITTSRLNEHGFGLKNSLATLSGDNGYWKLWTRSNASSIFFIEGPFRQEMIIRDNEGFPNIDFLPTSDISTLIKVTTRLSFIQGVQGRGAPSKDLHTLRTWLVEHLGVLYRGYLEQDEETNETSGVINVAIRNNTVRVPPIRVPIGKMTTTYVNVELCGTVHKLEYRYGVLDEVKRDKLVRGEKAKFYYQNNTPTQGIDIRLGKRVIATRQFETIWKTDNGQQQLSRHPKYNDFVGELLIPELPQGVLSTVNNKTDFNLDDPDWKNIFEQLNPIRPVHDIREKSESELRKKWLKMLRATNPEDTVTDEHSVWPTGTRIDVYRKTTDGNTIIYELKAGSGRPLDLYQLNHVS